MESAKDRGLRRAPEKAKKRHGTSHQNLDDKEQRELLEALADGDTSAFWVLWESHKSYLYTLCSRQMAHEPADAEDAMSRAMLLAWEKLPVHAPKITNLRAWLARMTRNLCIDIHKERQRWARFCDGDDDQLEAVPLERFMPGYRQPEIDCLDDELHELFRGAAQRLPERLRDAFLLRCWEEEPYSDIAGRLDISNANVRKRVQQARSVLGEAMGGYMKG